MHDDGQSSCGCFGSRLSSCVGALWFVIQVVGGSLVGSREYRGPIFWETGDKLVLAEESVENSHSTISLCSLDHKQ